MRTKKVVALLLTIILFGSFNISFADGYSFSEQEKCGKTYKLNELSHQEVKKALLTELRKSPRANKKIIDNIDLYVEQLINEATQENTSYAQIQSTPIGVWIWTGDPEYMGATRNNIYGSTVEIDNRNSSLPYTRDITKQLEVEVSVGFSGSTSLKKYLQDSNISISATATNRYTETIRETVTVPAGVLWRATKYAIKTTHKYKGYQIKYGLVQVGTDWVVMPVDNRSEIGYNYVSADGSIKIETLN